MIKSPSSTSTTSNNSGTADQPNKINPSLFNMFGTNVASPNQGQTNQQPMQKQTNPGAGMTSPKNNDNFADFWNNSSGKPGQTSQPVITPPNKATQPVTVPPPPIIKPTQPGPPPIQPPQNQNPPPKVDAPKQGSRAATFNQLFGLGNK